MRNLVLKVVTERINEWDPEGLLDLGAPIDEYETEIEEITEGVLEARDEIDIADEIQDVFKRYFGREYNFDRCLKVAKKIWEDLYT